ncbi:hypothetical protein [Ralstonia mannitolilytica]|uniref:hypothetical protein n=1 Tax=Ralstonia mannitolilytica TaxID=105219 RepID=UPI0028F60E44|nr:hypothetical protein [Ralstonia mannitolilytica]CAJ0740797.1 hypothetical protein R76696_03145 [Ralstonia mannitolilytica]
MIAVYDRATGEVLRYVVCPRAEYALNVRDGESCIEVDAMPQAHARVVEGHLVEVQLPEVALAYDEERRAAYPEVGAQLDAIWKAFASLDRGALPPDTAAMLDQVIAVKQQYPKP